MQTYRIDHITDLCLIPDEHLDEAFADLRLAVDGLKATRAVVEAVAAVSGGTPASYREMLPELDFVPDGKGEAAFSHQQAGDLFTIRRAPGGH